MAVTWRDETEAMIACNVVEASQVAEARRATVELTRWAGLSEDVVANIGLVVTEVASNLVYHATGGQIIARPVRNGGGLGVEVLAVDRGPGIQDVATSLRDGYSTRGGPGTGLGAVRRVASEFDLYSLPVKGTVVLARFWSHRGTNPPSGGIRIGVVCVPKAGEEVAGDQWATDVSNDRFAMVVVDGLGHGPLAQTAARTAVDTFRSNRRQSPADLCQTTHSALGHTRGAAFVALDVERSTRAVRFAGVGNIAARLVGGAQRYHFVSHNGIVGHRLGRLQEFTTSWDPTSMLVVHSDGLGSHWGLEAYPGLAGRDPSVIAAVLYRDHGRQTDDATVVVVRLDGPGGGQSA